MNTPTVRFAPRSRRRYPDYRVSDCLHYVILVRHTRSGPEGKWGRRCYSVAYRQDITAPVMRGLDWLNKGVDRYDEALAVCQSHADAQCCDCTPIQRAMGQGYVLVPNDWYERMTARLADHITGALTP